jgi:hypothetical protein
MMPVLVLYGGECDGYRRAVTFLEKPDIYYAVPMLDLEFVSQIKDAHTKEAAFKARQRLAYAFWEVEAGEEDTEYRYKRIVDQTQDLPPKTDTASSQ